MVLQAPGKPKSINKYYLLYGSSLGKHKRTKWDLLEVTAILSTSTSL